MKQLNTIEQLKYILPNVKGLHAAILYGSFGRNEGNPNSDIDIQILVNSKFQTQNLIDVLEKEFESDVQYITEVVLRKKIVFYFKTQPKLEFAVCNSLDEINRNYLGSEITEINSSVLFANNKWKSRIIKYLQEIVELNNTEKKENSTQKSALKLIDKFIYEFENCSTMHRRSDAFQFYFFYNIALHVVIQLNHLSKGETKFNFLPKNFVANTLTTEEQKTFYDLKGTLFLPEANTQKKKLLDFFYASIEALVDEEKQKELKQFCEWIYDRDFFWNFRDISTHNPKIKSGIVYRTAIMTFFQNENRFEKLVAKKKIKTVIDLRADREIEEHSYSKKTLDKFKYIKASFDPWNQPEWYKEKYNYGTNEEIAYRFFAIGCKDKIKSTIEAIIDENSGSVAIHCFAGKDRTGILVSLLHLLVDTPKETIYADYLASEVDVNPYRLKMVLSIINEKGGIIPYLVDCGLKETQVKQLKNKLLNGN